MIVPVVRERGEAVSVDQVLDVKGQKCPMPVIKAKKAIDAISVGQVLEVVATDPGSMADFKAWAKNTGHELLLAEEAEGIYRYQIRKSK